MVIAQESFADYGVSVKAEPSVDSERLGGLLGDTPIPVDGWVETEPAYPDNPDPWKGEYWYRVADSAAAEGGNGLWLNSAGLRGEKTDPLRVISIFSTRIFAISSGPVTPCSKPG